MAEKLPFMNSTGLISKLFTKIIEAQTPQRFSQDFQSAKLGYGSGSAKPFIPLLKRLGFVAADGSPTELYKRFRNTSHRGHAMAMAIRKGYAPLYAINEYAHSLDGQKLRDAVIQATGHEKDSGTVKAIVGTFNALKAFADFDASNNPDNDAAEPEITKQLTPSTNAPVISTASPPPNRGMNLSYTINLNLPESKDPEVFDAIFTSLKEKLLN